MAKTIKRENDKGGYNQIGYENIGKLEMLLEYLNLSDSSGKARAIAKKMLIILDIIRAQKNPMCRELERLRDFVKDYSRKRVIWAEFLIGMRKYPGSDRKKVTLTAGGRLKMLGKQ